MIKKVQYELIDTNVLPLDLICKNSALDQFVGLDEKFMSEWIDITTRLSNVRQEVTKNFASYTGNKKSELYISFINQCGLVLIDDININTACKTGT